MPGKIKISIPSPCHENWQAMTPVDKGRFCAACQKNVFDFTNASDREIAAALQTGNACGRFRANQLERELIIPKEKNKIWMAASAAAVTLLTIGNHTLSAQTPVHTEQTENKTDDIKSITTGLARTVMGKVEDQDGMPLPGVTIIIPSSQIATSTDMDGIFNIEFVTGTTLQFHYLGYSTHEEIITDKNSYDIKLIPNPEKLESVTVIGFGQYRDRYVTGGYAKAVVIQQKRTFFGRIFHSIGNIFR